MAVRWPSPSRASCEWVAAATSRQSPGQRGVGHVRQKKKSNGLLPLLCPVAQSAVRHCLAVFCELHVDGCHTLPSAVD